MPLVDQPKLNLIKVDISNKSNAKFFIHYL